MTAPTPTAGSAWRALARQWLVHPWQSQPRPARTQDIRKEGQADSHQDAHNRAGRLGQRPPERRAAESPEEVRPHEAASRRAPPYHTRTARRQQRQVRQRRGRFTAEPMWRCVPARLRAPHFVAPRARTITAGAPVAAGEYTGACVEGGGSCAGPVSCVGAGCRPCDSGPRRSAAAPAGQPEPGAEGSAAHTSGRHLMKHI